MSGPAADVVVVTYNPGDTITSFLDSVVGVDGVASVTVVDNDSKEDVGARVLSSKSTGFTPVSFTSSGGNLGYGTAANIGARSGSAPWILVSNADIVVGPGAIQAMVAVGEADEAIGMVGPAVRETDGTLYPSARPLPGLVMGAGHAILGKVWPTNPWTRSYKRALDPDGSGAEAGWLSGSCFLVRRSAWEKVGGFDESFFMFFEDVDLGRRLGEAGYRLVWTPTATVTHIGGHTWRTDPTPMLTAHHESAKRYVRLAYPHWWQSPARALAVAVLSARQRSEIAASHKNPDS